MAYSAKKQYDRAIKDFTQAITIDPNYAYAFYNRGLAYANKKQYDRAIKDYTQAIAIDPNLAEAFNNRGYVYDEKKQYDRAIEDYTKTIAIDPNYASAFNNRAVTFYFAKNDTKRACADAKKSHQLGNDGLYNYLRDEGLCGF